MKTQIRRYLAGLLFSLGLLLIVLVVYLLSQSVFLFWILRDGLGPNAAESTGLEAVGRWGAMMGQMLLVCLSLSAVGSLLCWIGLRVDPYRQVRREANGGPT